MAKLLSSNTSLLYQRVRTPTIIQMEETECGAVALGIVMSYYRHYASMEDLRFACGVSRDGSNVQNIVKAGEHYGLEVQSHNVDIKNLYEMKASLPAVLLWNKEHFVVLEGFGKDRAYINDPASGPRSVSKVDFERAYSGIIITFKPGKAFEKSGKPPNLLQVIFQRSKKIKMPLLYVALTGICLVIPNLAFPAFTQVFIDEVLVGNSLSWQNGIIEGLLLATIGSACLIYLQQRALNRLQTRLSMRIGSDTLWHMLRLPMSFFNQRYPGEIAYRLSLNESVSKAITGNLASTAINVLFIFVYGIAILYYDVIIALIAFAMIALEFILLRWTNKARSDAVARYQADLSKSTIFSLGGLQNIETLHANHMGFKFFSKWVGYYTKVVNTLQEVGKKDIFLAVMSPFLNSMTTLTLFGIGIWRILNGSLTIGMFVALQMLLRYLMNPVMQLVGFSQSIQLLKVDASRLNDLLSQPVDPLFLKKVEPQVTDTKLKGHAEMRGIVFGYNFLDAPILENINLEISPGKSVALIGPTGCGKSTIAKLFAGLFHSWKGEILFDDKPSEQIPLKIIVNSLSLVEQEPFIFNGTVKENLTMMDPEIDMEDIIRAAKDARIHNEILSRQGGYDHVLEENGANLSQGQRQRLEIARGLIKNPSMLILDEATSALDSGMEEEIIKNIRRRGCAVLIIAHRLSTIRSCDEILIMEKGKIIEKGTHDELKQKSKIYQKFIEA